MVDQASYTMIQFILSVAIIIIVVFALQEDKITCKGTQSDDNDYGYFWFDTLNTLSTVPLGCSIITFLFIYIKTSNHDDTLQMVKADSVNPHDPTDHNEEEKKDQKPEMKTTKIDKIHIAAFIFQPCLPLLFLSGAIIEFLAINGANSDCFDQGLNVGVSIICDGVAVLLLLANVIYHALIWIINKYGHHFKMCSSKDDEDEDEDMEQSSDMESEEDTPDTKKRLKGSVELNVLINKEGDKENTDSYVNNPGSSPSTEYVHDAKDDENVKMIDNKENSDDLE